MKAQIETPPIHHPVRLAEGKVEGPSDFFNLLFEYIIFFRWIYFKNRPRGNLLFIRATLIVGFYSFLFMRFRHDFELIFLGIDVDPVLFFAGAVAVGYWNMLQAFYGKSSACNEIYIEMMKAGGEGNKHKARLLSTALSIEALTMDLWAHRTYRILFARNLYRAIEHAYSKESRPVEVKLPASPEAMYKKINSGHLQAKEARLLLDNYQEYLMHCANLYYKQQERTRDSEAQAA